jgi:hypothetical protein
VDVLGETGGKSLEVVGAGDEVRLAVDLDNGRVGRIAFDDDETLLGGAGRLLRGGGLAALAQHDLGFVEVALGFVESLLALHHARAGAFAELLYELSCNFGHILTLLPFQFL